MDDNGYITFTDVSMSTPSGQVEAFSNTTLQIDYSTNTVSVVGGGALTFNGVSYTNFALTSGAVDGPTHFALTSGTPGIGPMLELNWTGQSPTAFDNLSTVIPGPFTSFVTNTITPAICFAAGTLIRTPAGDVAVETLKAGDLVLTASGDMRPVKWMGHTDVDFRRTPRASPGLPIRIAADAFGPARPSRDLYLSAGHSVCLDLLGEVLIPVGYLLNGSTIAEIETDEITYWHVELDGQDILVANNLPAESYLAMGNRGSFEELRGLLPAMVEGQERTHADFCRPVATEGPIIEFVRQRLVARAEELGWTQVRDADLHLMVDGRVVRPLAEDDAAAFLFPASAKDVRLMSNTFVPAAFGLHDQRRLGVMVVGLVLSGSVGEPRRVSIDDDRLCDGLYGAEASGPNRWRWTNGEFVLDPGLWEGLSGQISLHVAYDRTTVRGWFAPPACTNRVDEVYRPKLYAVS